jgi:hypothetical protein
MSLKKTAGYCWLMLLTGSISSCSEPERIPLAGHYYSTQSEDGEPRLYFDDPKHGPVYLKDAIATGVTKSYVVACWDSCYLFPVAAATAEAAHRGQIGPFDEAACKQKVLQLTSDSLHLARVLD